MDKMDRQMQLLILFKAIKISSDVTGPIGRSHVGVGFSEWERFGGLFVFAALIIGM